MDWVSRTDLIDPRRLKALSQRSDAKGALQLASHLGAMLVTGYGLWASWGTWWMAPFFVAHGYLLNCLFATQHEANHQTAFKTRWMNDATRAFTGFMQIYPAWWEAWFHFAHHRHTGDWNKDAELIIRGKYTLGSYLYYLSGIGYWVNRVRLFAKLLVGNIPAYATWLSPSQRATVVRETRLDFAGYVILAALSVYFESWAVVTLWLLPMLATKPLHQLQNLGEHLGLEDGGLDTTKNTRTLLVPGIVRWALWFMPYHAAHHTFPGVPFHQLKALHDEIEAKLGRKLPNARYFEVVRQVIRHSRRGDEGTWRLPFAAGGARPEPGLQAAE
ncbi:MAG: rhizopine catabolism protein [Alphaproteobacteria bacterium]|nr:rhizopine catabolism protein [Alphaproteobacteria bacterium]